MHHDQQWCCISGACCGGAAREDELALFLSENDGSGGNIKHGHRLMAKALIERRLIKDIEEFGPPEFVQQVRDAVGYQE